MLKRQTHDQHSSTTLLAGEGCGWYCEYADPAQPGWHLHGAMPGSGPRGPTPPLGATLDPLQDQQQVNLSCYFIFLYLFRPQTKLVFIKVCNKIYTLLTKC